MERTIQPGESVTVAVTEAISVLEDRPVETFEPLHDVLDSDLDELFDFDRPGERADQPLRFTFEYMDYYVTIDNTATLSVERKPEQPFVVGPGSTTAPR